jgi:hypothetical protein
MNTTPDATTAGNGGSFDPRQAADLLDQTTQQARRTFTSGTPLLWAFRSVLVLVALGGYWLSVRGKPPYSAPAGWVVAATFALVAVNIVWSTWLLKRASAGVSGPAQRMKQVFIAIMVAIWVIAYVVVYAAAPNHALVTGLYPANAPLLIVGVAAAVGSAVRKDWSTTVITAAIAVLAALAGLGGPVGVWGILGVGFCALCLGAAAYKAWQEHRSVIRP